MGSEWKFVSLSDVLDIQHGWAFKGAHMNESIDSGPIVVAIGNFNYEGGFRFESTKIKRYTSEFPVEYILSPGDMLLAMTCQTSGGEILGIPGVIPDDGRIYLHNQRLGKVLIKDPSLLHMPFLYYLFKSKPFNHSLYLSATGTKILHTSPSKITAYGCLMPERSEQVSIAHILGTLDDKIELNRRMNETLESMARALFKSWFVDFDPVIDNALAAGNAIPEPLAVRAVTRRALGPQRKPLPANIQKLFPATFTFDEEMGWVPEGWDVNPLGTYLKVLETGRRPKGGVAEYTKGVPSVGAESIDGIGNFDFGKTKFVPHEFFDAMNSGKVQCHDVLLYKDGGKPGEFKPRIGMFGRGFPFEEFGINEHVFRLRSDALGQPFLYFQTASERVFHHLAVRGGKAAIPGINQTEAKSVAFLVPSDALLEKFNTPVFAMIDRILDNASSSRCLARLRDTLLPKLLSGELRIPEAEKLVAGSV